MSDDNSCITCVRRNHADLNGLTWCDKKTGVFEFCFVDLDHAAENGYSKGRLVACKDCTDAAINALTEGQAE